MAKRKHKKAKQEEPEITEQANHKHKSILGIVLLVAGLFIFFSIISYTRSDDGILHFNLVKDFSTVPQGKSGITGNWLGTIGAYVSYFFLRNTIGIFSLIFPALFFLWGIGQFVDISLEKKLRITNLALFFGLLSSAFFGIIRHEQWLFYSFYELNGQLGDVIASVLVSLLGALGSILLIFAISTVVFVIAFDLNLLRIFQNLQERGKVLTDKIQTAKDNALSSKEAESEKITDKPQKKKITTQPDVMDPVIITPAEPRKTNIKINRTEPVDSTGRTKTSLNVKQKSTDSDSSENGELSEKENIRISTNTDEIPDSEDIRAIREMESELPEPWEENINYQMPSLNLLIDPPEQNFVIAEEELKRNAKQLKEKLALFDIEIEDIEVTPGPVVTLYEIKPAPGVKISRIVSLENDIALALAAKGIRIIAPIPGKSAIGVEIPNSEASLVVAKSVLSFLSQSKAELPLALGKTISGDVYITDLSKMPHLLIAGATGAGKSVGVNMIIASLLYSRHPAQVKLAIVDPKKIELAFYSKLRQHFLAICPDLDEDIVTVPMNAVLLLKSVELEMEKRYDMLAKAGVRNIIDYNAKIVSGKPMKEAPGIKHHFLPYIVVIVDELADLMITSGKEIEEPITRLAQLARAVGIHLILATQRPSVNVITGTIKANFSTRIAYQVATKIDSRTILDMNGGEQLLGRGDMLFLPPGSPKPIRIQNAFISTDEVEKITDYIKLQPGFSKPYYLPSVYDKKRSGDKAKISDLDPLFEDAARVIIQSKQASVSLLQRRLKLGYARAARIMDQLEEAGIVGPNDGSKARTILVENEEQLETILRNL